MVQKECKKCGMLINENDSSCLYCGGQEFCESKPKNKKTIKKLIPLIGVVLAILIFYSFASSLDDTLNSEEEINETEVVNFDLSEYDSYGELSCGRIWVTKTISDWDKSPEQYFAYLDADGNVIYDWTPVGNSHPQDFKDGYAMIIWSTGHSLTLGSGLDATNQISFIDVNGNVLHENTTIYVEYDYDYKGSDKDIRDRFYITDFDEDFYAYFIGEVIYPEKEDKKFYEEDDNEKWGLHWLDKNGVHTFNYDFPYTSSVIHSVERIDEYFFVSCGAYSVLLDSLGNPIIDFPEASDITPDKIELLDDNQIKVYFEGRDGNDYQCILNYEGEFLTEPICVE